jgi:hypothetical protein
MQPNRPSPYFQNSDLIDAGRKTIRKVQKLIRRLMEQDPDRALEPVSIGSRGKEALRIDLMAEDVAEAELSRALHHYAPHILGMSKASWSCLIWWTVPTWLSAAWGIGAPPSFSSIRHGGPSWRH